MSRFYNDEQDRPSPQGYGAIAVLILAFITLVVGFITLSWESVPPDKIMLHYTGGPFDGTKFVEVVQPGTSTKIYGLSENFWFLPTTQRNYIFDKNPETGDKGTVDFIIGVSKDNVQFEFELAAYFKLNLDPQTLRQFFEQVCLHDHCYDLDEGHGWDKMLAQYFRPQIENAVRLEAGKYTREELYRDPDTLRTMQKDIEKMLKDAINDNIGGDYFCGPDSSVGNCTDFAVILKNPTPPLNVVTAYAETAASGQRVTTAQNDAKAKVAAAEGERDAQNTRAESKPLTQAQIDFIKAQALLACAQNTNCTLVVTDGSADVNVNTG